MQHLTIIDRYIGKEILASFVAVFFVLMLIVTSVETVYLLSWVVEGRISESVFLAYLINSLLELSILLIPLCLLMGVLLAFGRLYKDSEMTAIMSAGCGPYGWYRPLLMVAVPVSLAMLILTLFVMPLVSQQHDQLSEATYHQADLNTLFAGRFNRSRTGDTVIFLESLADDGNVMNHVFQRHRRGAQNHVDVAERARNQKNADGRDYTVMENGTHYVGEPGSPDFRIIEYREYGVYVRGNRNKQYKKSYRSVESYSSRELWQSEQLDHRAQLQWRFTIPIATLMIALLALPLSHTTPRSGRYANLAWAILLYLLYSNFLGVGKTWIVRETVPVWVGTWWVHLLALALLLLLLKKRGYIFLKSTPVATKLKEPGR